MKQNETQRIILFPTQANDEWLNGTDEPTNESWKKRNESENEEPLKIYDVIRRLEKCFIWAIFPGKLWHTLLIYDTCHTAPPHDKREE